MAGNLEWLNQNSLRSYPFREDTSLVDDSGLTTLPNSLVVDFVMVSPSEVELELQLKSLLFGTDLLSMSFGDASGNTVTSVSISLDSHKENDGYRLSGQGNYEDAVGRITIGNLSELPSQLPEGSYSYALGAALLEQTVVRPDIRGVRALKIAYADGTESNPIYGLVKLLAGLNVRLSTSDDGQGIRIDALSTDLEEECDCDSEFLRPKPITSFGGATPDPGGNVNIVVQGEHTKLTGSQGLLTIEDSTTEPCCGCTELEELTKAMETAIHTTERLEEFLQKLDNKQANLISNVLRSIV